LETTLQSKAFGEFAEAATGIMNPHLKAWLDQGGKAAGYFCSTVPEEILMAAGYLPFRIRGTGSTDTELSDAFFSPINCSFPRHAFNHALKGEYDFLDALICINSCDHVRRVYDNWVKNVEATRFATVMSLPRKVGERQVAWYVDEINILRKQLEEHLGIEITDEKIRDAIKTQNEIRKLQKKLYELRKDEKPPITGAETLAVMVAGTSLPKEKYTELLEQLLEDLKEAEGNGDYRARLMILGSELDDPEYVKIIEDQGGLVVTDSTCYGTRLMWVQVDETEEDPVRALARFYVQTRPSCPRMYGNQPERIAFTRKMAEEFKVDGIIGERLQFCDNWLVEHYMTKYDLREHGDIPFLQLDREYILSGKGQIKTRVQAFLETMDA
jgi:benzoyl-CoA reductase/2-hydroxyglutaryl-CoA dehydratase subunit BcrC/BadD/HgdB